MLLDALAGEICFLGGEWRKQFHRFARLVARAIHFVLEKQKENDRQSLSQTRRENWADEFFCVLFRDKFPLPPTPPSTLPASQPAISTTTSPLVLAYLCFCPTPAIFEKCLEDFWNQLHSSLHAVFSSNADGTMPAWNIAAKSVLLFEHIKHGLLFLSDWSKQTKMTIPPAWTTKRVDNLVLAAQPIFLRLLFDIACQQEEDPQEIISSHLSPQHSPCVTFSFSSTAWWLVEHGLSDRTRAHILDALWIYLCLRASFLSTEISETWKNDYCIIQNKIQFCSFEEACPYAARALGRVRVSFLKSLLEGADVCLAHSSQSNFHPDSNQTAISTNQTAISTKQRHSLRPFHCVFYHTFDSEASVVFWPWLFWKQVQPFSECVFWTSTPSSSGNSLQRRQRGRPPKFSLARHLAFDSSQFQTAPFSIQAWLKEYEKVALLLGFPLSWIHFCLSSSTTPSCMRESCRILWVYDAQRAFTCRLDNHCVHLTFLQVFVCLGIQALEQRAWSPPAKTRKTSESRKEQLQALTDTDLTDTDITVTRIPNIPNKASASLEELQALLRIPQECLLRACADCACIQKITCNKTIILAFQTPVSEKNGFAGSAHQQEQQRRQQEQEQQQPTTFHRDLNTCLQALVVRLLKKHRQVLLDDLLTRAYDDMVQFWACWKTRAQHSQIHFCPRKSLLSAVKTLCEMDICKHQEKTLFYVI